MWNICDRWKWQIKHSSAFPLIHFTHSIQSERRQIKCGVCVCAHVHKCIIKYTLCLAPSSPPALWWSIILSGLKPNHELRPVLQVWRSLILETTQTHMRARTHPSHLAGWTDKEAFGTDVNLCCPPLICLYVKKLNSHLTSMNLLREVYCHEAYISY